MAWTDISSAAEGQQITAELLNQIIDNLSFLRTPPYAVYARDTTDPNLTTTSTSFVALTGFQVNIITQGNPIHIMFDAAINGYARFDFYVDGASITGSADGLAGNGSGVLSAISISRRVPVAAGPHTVAVYWRVTSGTGTLRSDGLNQLRVVEWF